MNADQLDARMKAARRQIQEGQLHRDPGGGPREEAHRIGVGFAQGLDALSKMTAVQSITKRVCAAQTSGISVALMEGVERGVADLIERLDALDAH